jgi:hypothetical protein
MALKGNPQTFRNGTVIVTPITQSLVATANATSIPLVIKSGSIDGEIEVAEAPTNQNGTLVAYGNAKTTLELSCYASQANLTAPFSNGTAWTFKRGDFLTANITAGSLSIIGTFMITKYATSLDPNDILNMDFSLQNHGDLTTENCTLVAN